METSSLRAQLRLVGVGYAAVLAFATLLVVQRYLLYLRHPQDAAAAGGMYAAGDWMLEIFIAGMLLLPTFFLALIIRNREELYTTYSKVMLALSLTAPLCLAFISIPAVGQASVNPVKTIGMICLDRLFCSPVFLVAFAGSRLLARFGRAKRLTLYALLIEAGTLILTAFLFVFA